MLEVTQLTSSVVVKHTIFIPWERPGKVADTLPPDTLPPNWHQQRRQDAARIIQVTYDSLISHYHWWSQGANVTFTCIQKVFAWLAVAARWPRHQESLAVRRSHGIAYYPVFAVGDWVSCRMGALLLIFLAASTKLCFISCCQAPLLFRPQLLSQSGKHTPAYTTRTLSIFASFCTIAATVTNVFNERCVQVKKKLKTKPNAERGC